MACSSGYSRDKAILTDIYTLTAHLPEGTVIGTTPANCSDWALIAYMSRVGYLSLDGTGRHEYFIARIGEPIDTFALDRYEKQDWGLRQLVIYKAKTALEFF